MIARKDMVLVTVPMSGTLKTRLQKLSDDDGRSMAAYVRRLIETAYDEKYALNNAEPIGKANVELV